MLRLRFRRWNPALDVSGLFISYRREDAGGFARGIYDHLRQHFDAGKIFRDIDTIKGGDDFVERIESAIDSSAVVLVVIGKRWSNSRDTEGRRRLDHPQDFVRLEIAAALQRDVPVIPVLLQGTPMPGADELPEELKPLARRHALKLSDDRWEYDLSQLVERLHEIPGLAEIGLGADVDRESPPREKPGAPPRRPVRGLKLFGVALLVLIVLAAGWRLFKQPSASPRLAISPGALNFGEQTVGSPAATMRTVVRNNGKAAISIDDVLLSELTGQHFTIRNDRCNGATLIAKDECVIELAFAPKSVDAHAGALTVKSTLERGAASTVQRVDLRGVGTVPRVRLEILGIDVDDDLMPAAIRLTALVNEKTYVYPSIGDVKWLEVGPEMTTQSFALPSRPDYQLRFEMQLRRLNEPERNLISQTTADFTLADLPLTKSYSLYNKNRIGTRGARRLARVKYSLSRTP